MYTNQIKDTGRDITLHRRIHPQSLRQGHIKPLEHINSDCTRSKHPTVGSDKGQVKAGVPNEMIVRVRSGSGRGGVRRGRHLVVGKFADTVDAESYDGDAKARESVAELIAQHRMLPPLVPSPEELSGRSQWLPHFPIFGSCSLLISTKLIAEWSGALPFRTSRLVLGLGPLYGRYHNFVSPFCLNFFCFFL
ncbi:hypothetical protein HAX54_023746 [Datura stramonium]|uniref:Uncharacterized protein n=1 Tax=Datura stramonium TaxID=4076 RepID=A0ABS8UZ21_DATST|nr:hypothetical protein [Datura stramonium]